MYNRKYLAEKLLKVTDRLNITRVIVSITRDNTALNNIILDTIEVKARQQFDLINDFDKARFSLKFNRVNGDIRCYAYIYNLAV